MHSMEDGDGARAAVVALPEPPRQDRVITIGCLGTAQARSLREATPAPAHQWGQQSHAFRSEPVDPQRPDLAWRWVDLPYEPPKPYPGWGCGLLNHRTSTVSLYVV